jgi:hypothetical protein
VREDLREELGARGEKVSTRRRNVRVDGPDVDLLVETDKAAHVEVKEKPADAKKAEVAGRTCDKFAVVILAGARGDVGKYAKGRGVLTYRY